MRKVTLEEFEHSADSYNRSVLETSGIVHYCSCSDWVLVARSHIHQGGVTEIYVEDGHWLVFVHSPLFGLVWALHPVESTWCLACPLLGPEPRHTTKMLAQLLSSQERFGEFVLVGGIPMGSPLHGFLKKEVGRFRKVMSFPGTNCIQADLTGGLEQYLIRRSQRFRAQERRRTERLSSCGVEFEFEGVGCDGASAFDRVLRIEKGHGNSILEKRILGARPSQILP